MMEGLFQKGDKVLHRRSGFLGVIDDKSQCIAGWFYIKWDDGRVGFHECAELELVYRVKIVYQLSYFDLTEALKGDHPYTTPVYSPDAEYTFYCLLAYGKVRSSDS